MSDPRAVFEDAQALILATRLEEAEALLRGHLASGSWPVLLWRQLASVVRLQGRMQETQALQQMIVQQLPGDMHARFDLAETYLMLGDFERGWREYRFRYEMQHTQQMTRHVQRPRWKGQALAGKTLLIHDEQGYGDTFQFMRLVAQVRARAGGRVIFEVKPECLGLARRFLGEQDVLAAGSLPPPFDLHCELMSLPQALQLRLDELPGAVGYLSPDPARMEKWRRRLQDLPRPLVGLVWAGRASHVNDFRRSLALADLAPLALPGVTFLALQKGPASAQARTPPAGMQLLALDEEIADFEDSAAIMSLIDLTISVDSAPLHLAGALNRPAWGLLAFVPCWRWLMQREDSPWYPSVRLFRQSAPDHWQTMLQRMAGELASLRDAHA